MRQHKGFDNILLIATLMLVGIGIVMVYSASAIIAEDRFNNEYFFLKRQAAFAFISIVIMFIVTKIDHQFYKSTAYVILGISITSLILVLVPGVGSKIGGSTRWFRIAAISIQPSEFAKLGLIIYLAYSLSKKKKGIKTFSVGVLPHLIITGIIFLLIMQQPDMGTALCLGVIMFTMLFASGVRLSHLSLILISVSPVIYFLIINKAYRLERWTAFLNPWKDPADSGFQVIQSLYAFGSGGIFGRGLGDGKQKLFYLPEPHTDFIFSVIGEELGLIGVLIVIGIFLIFIYRGIMIAIRSSDLFSIYLALGITTLIGLQAIIHLGVTMGLLPTKGIPLPYISYGGSSLLTNMIGLGILLNISSQVKKR
ncbi:MAG: putative lipid II flippase FtsW [Thermodesulfobacteriota bacterium]|nr:putative lipid II flippase FtsW [Thermodesulfobacteriota bacterium]